MKKTQSLNQNVEFKRLYYKGARMVAPLLVLYYSQNKRLRGLNLLGITVSTKVSNRAVKRNKVRRWIAESYRAFEPKIKTGYNIVILAREGAEKADFWAIKKFLGGALKRAELFENNEK